jgi:4-diphosphocytidyl-2C-methyl-D-erythritol kinase
VFQSIDVCDTLLFEEDDHLSLSHDAPRLASGDSNLVIKSARELASAFGVTRGARIRLEKRIPWGAGLGGGSADAAATLVGLDRLWGLRASREDLWRIAAGLGSDVPFFLTGGRALGTSRGEIVRPLPDGPPLSLVLLFPPFSISTPTVYRSLSFPPLTPAGLDTTLVASDAEVFPDRNDLEPAAEALRGELRGLRKALRDVGARSARLSGSGSTVFGVFDDLQSAREAADRLHHLPSGTRVRIASTLSRDELFRRASG